VPRNLTAKELERHKLTSIKAACDAEFEWLEPSVEAAEGETKLKKFSITAYTGGPMRVGFGYPVVVDLAGMTVPAASTPILKDHDATQIVGHTDSVDKSVKRLKLTGMVSGVGDAAQEVIALGANGFPWQASIGASIEEMQFLDKGESANVNGRAISGPVYIARKSALRETSFVAIGADAGTSGRIAANFHERKSAMDPELKAYIEGMGFDVAALSEVQIAGLKASMEAAKKKPEPAKTSTIDEIIAANAAEHERITTFNEIMASATLGRNRQEIEDLKKVYDGAVSAKWDVDKFKLVIMQASRFNVPIHSNSSDDKLPTKDVLEAAICKQGRLTDVDTRFSPQVLEAADQYNRKEGGGLTQLYLTCAEANGYRGRGSRITPEVQRYAFAKDDPRMMIQASGFSTLSISTILSNVANKFLMDGWNSVDMTLLRIAAIRSVNDFKEITTVSLTGDLQFEKVGPAGEIKHGTLGEKTYGNKADSYAKMLAITFQDYRNDDLGALTRAPRRLGRGGALKLNDIGWTEFLNPSIANFWHTSNNNVNTGVADATIAGLAATEVIFMNQTDPDGKPLGLEPKIWLVPPALKALAIAICDPQSQQLITGVSATLPAINVFRGRFRVESSPYMANSSYTGYDAAANYLLADPADMPVIEVVALDGRVEPVVETAEAEFNVLGTQLRGHNHVGVRAQEPRGGVRADGGTS
jgi:hypothetical protein